MITIIYLFIEVVFLNFFFFLKKFDFFKSIKERKKIKKKNWNFFVFFLNIVNPHLLL